MERSGECIRRSPDIAHFFFFSSRRRHTRFKCDWSSDVCSSDLGYLRPPTPEQVAAGANNRVFLDGDEVTQEIRTAEVAQAASRLATIAKVRQVLVAEQQRAGAGGGIVMEGRDIGTVVFPKAELKIFLDASPEVRAERRWKEHQEKGDRLTLPEVFDEVIERDKRDRERKVSPLLRATDAVLVDNTAMGIEETARLIVMLAREREKELAGAAGGKP